MKTCTALRNSAGVISFCWACASAPPMTPKIRNDAMRGITWCWSMDESSGYRDYC